MRVVLPIFSSACRKGRPLASSNCKIKKKNWAPHNYLYWKKKVSLQSFPPSLVRLFFYASRYFRSEYSGQFRNYKCTIYGASENDWIGRSEDGDFGYAGFGANERQVEGRGKAALQGFSEQTIFGQPWHWQNYCGKIVSFIFFSLSPSRPLPGPSLLSKHIVKSCRSISPSLGFPLPPLLYLLFTWKC